MAATLTNGHGTRAPIRLYSWAGGNTLAPHVLARAARDVAKKEGLKQGREEGKKEAFTQVRRSIEGYRAEQDRLYVEAITRAMKTSEEIFDRLNSRLEVECERIYLREIGFREFEALFFVSADHFISNRLSEAYDFADEVARSTQEDGFNYTFSFVPLRGSLRHEALLVDGYDLWFPAPSDEEKYGEVIH